MIQTSIATGLLVIASLAPEATSAALAPAAEHRTLLFEVKSQPGADDGNEGDEGDEGNEGLQAFAGENINAGDEGNEGDDGNEGDEGDEGEEGDEGNEGDEGDAAPVPPPTSGGIGFASFDNEQTIGSSVSCTAKSDAEAFTFSSSTAVRAISEAFFIVCDPQRVEEITVADVQASFTGTADVIARAITSSESECESTGNAFGCATAQAKASAWASSTAEAYARAYAEAYSGCTPCDPNLTAQVTASTEGISSTFITLVADVFARAETLVCVTGDQAASAEAMSNCFAQAYANIMTTSVAQALIGGGCLKPTTEVFANAATSADFNRIESCVEKFDTTGGGITDTEGTTAEVTVEEVAEDQ